LLTLGLLLLDHEQRVVKEIDLQITTLPALDATPSFIQRTLGNEFATFLFQSQVQSRKPRDEKKDSTRTTFSPGLNTDATPAN